MDELISLMGVGIKLAKEIEVMLQIRVGRLEEMASKIDEITRVFITVRERLNSIRDPNLYSQMLYLGLQQQQQLGPCLLQQHQEYANSVRELFQTQFLPETMPHPPPSSSDLGGVQTVAAVESPSQRPQRRKEDGEKRRRRVGAPRMGNADIPPEDGFTWRKYGQKEILGSKFPRGYYRCTHLKLYGCPAKKQVQRLDDDPFTFEVTYRGDHTCHTSAAPPPPPPSPSDPNVSPLPWLEFSLGGSGAGPISGYQSDQYLVADLADVMFNSGSSSGNSMELIFTATSSMDQDKWDL